jgi:lysophospholipase L1-like esterase
MDQTNAPETPVPLPVAEPQLHRTKILRLLGRDLLVLLAIGGLIETGLHVGCGMGGRPQLFDAEFTGGKPNAVNALGLRGPAVTPAKKPGELRILGLGDSTTFGTGVAWEEAWPNQAAIALEARLSRDVVGINAGAPGGSVRDMAFAVDHAWGDLQPEVVVLVVSGNMVSLAWIRREQAGSMPAHEQPPAASLAYQLKTGINQAYRYLQLPSQLALLSEKITYQIGLQNHNVPATAPYGALLAHGWRQVGLDPAIAADAWRLFEQDLGTLRDRVRARNARLYVGSLPARFLLTNGAGDNEKNVPLHRLSIVPGERVQEICSRLGVPTIDLTQALRQARETSGKSLYPSMDYTHLNPDGHQVIANAIAQRVVQDTFGH